MPIPPIAVVDLTVIPSATAHWTDGLSAQTPAVLVMVRHTRGSSPRESGALMLVGEQGQLGSIGGGHLELHASDRARVLLSQHSTKPATESLTLSSRLGQCCGGVVELLYLPLPPVDEAVTAAITQARRWNTPFYLYADLRQTPARFHWSEHPPALESDDEAQLVIPVCQPQRVLWLFGAGHVGAALVQALAPLPVYVQWIDSREQSVADSGAGLHCHFETEADEVLPQIGNDDFVLVLTHDHQQDFDILRQLLRRSSMPAFCGMIGSVSKWRRFSQRLLAQGIAAERLAQIHCPIGVDGIASKLPAVIAAAVVAQLLQVLTQQQAAAARPLAAAESLPTL